MCLSPHPLLEFTHLSSSSPEQLTTIVAPPHVVQLQYSLLAFVPVDLTYMLHPPYVQLTSCQPGSYQVMCCS